MKICDNLIIGGAIMSSVDNTIRKIRSARQRGKEILANSKDELEREDAEFLLEQIDTLVKSMLDYTETVFDDNISKSNRNQDSYELDDRQKLMEGVERRRKIAHDGLITDVRLTDSICRNMGIEEIYGKLPKEYQDDVSGLLGEENRKRPGVVETRHAIADWAFDFVLGCTVAFELNLNEMNYDKNLEDREKIAQTFKGMGGVTGGKRQINDIISFER